jgi:transposase
MNAASELLALSDWLESHGCTHVAMKATGVYWKPVWHLLEGRFELVLANAQYKRNVPGRQDRRQCRDVDRRLAGPRSDPEQLRSPAPIQELRDLTRTRKQLVREIAQYSLRIQKVLEDASIKLARRRRRVAAEQTAEEAAGREKCLCSSAHRPARQLRRNRPRPAASLAETRSRER